MGMFLYGVVVAGVVLAVFLPSVITQDADTGLFTVGDTLCNGTATSGKIVLSPGLNMTTCTIIVHGNNSSYTTILFSRLDLQGTDSLTIYDGSTSLMNVNGSPESLVVIIMSENASLVINIKANNSNTVLEATYNSSVCSIEQTVSDRSVLRSPVYLPARLPFNCTYQLKQQAGLAGSKLALSFTQLTLPNATLSITYAPAGDAVFSGTSLPPDVYIGSDSQHLALTVPNVSQPQNFSAIFTAITSSPECGLVKNVTAMDTLNISVPASQATVGYDCRVTLVAAKGKSLWLNVTSVNLAEHGDNVELVDGGAMAGSNLLASITASSSSGYLALSSQRQVLVRLTLGVLPSNRNLIINVKELDTVNHLYTEGSFNVSPSSGSEPTTSYYVLESNATSVVKFVLSDESVNKTVKNSYNVSVYDGDQPHSPLLVTFSNAQRVPVVGSGSRMLVVVSMSNTSQSMTASFSSRAPGCDTVTSATEGSFQLVTSPAVPAMCNWTVTAPPSSNGTILVDMAVLKLPQNASLSVYSGVSGSGGSLVARLTSFDTLSSLPLPSVAVPASQWAQVVWSSGDTKELKSVAVNVRYQLRDTLCGGDIQSPHGRLHSPSFPNLYPLNSLCNWTFPPPATPNTSAVLVFDFPQFQLAPNHSVVITKVTNGTSEQVASLNGTEPLSDVVFTSNASNALTFSAQLPKSDGITNQVAQGFEIQYWTLDCGGFTDKAKNSFVTPGFPAQIPVGASNATLCVWMVRLPKKTGDDVNIVNVTLQIWKTGSPNVSDIPVVKVYDGDTLRHGLVAWNVSKGDQFNVSALSRFNSVMVVFNTSAMTNADVKIAVRVDYTTYRCNKTQLCANGVCMHPDWICNGNDDCGDNSDERNCVGPPAPVNPTSKDNGLTPALVVLLFFVGLILGILLAIIIPRIIRRFRTNRYTTFRDDPPVA